MISPSLHEIPTRRLSERQVRAAAVDLDLDVSDLPIAVVRAAVGEARSRRWQEENAEAIAAYSARIAAEGLALARFRRFSTQGLPGPESADDRQAAATGDLGLKAPNNDP